MRYAVEVGSSAMMYISSSIKIGSDVQNFMVGGSQAQTAM
jgi:hypothetical protein